MTSTKGTMLMSESEVPVWRFSCGIGIHPFDACTGCKYYSPHSSRPQALGCGPRRRP
jgi:hypothetical protein